MDQQNSSVSNSSPLKQM